MKIFLGTIEIAGCYISLYRALRKIGVKVDYYCMYHVFEYASISEYPNIIGKALYLLTKYQYILTKDKKRIFGILSLKRFTWNLLGFLILVTRIILLIFSIFRYNVFIFTFGESILPMNLDLPLLKFLKKKIIFNLFNGSEARPKYINPYLTNPQQKEKVIEEIYKNTKIKKKKLEVIQKYSDYIVSFFFISHFLRRKYIDFFYLGIPHYTPTPSYTPENKNQIENEEKIYILHAPSNPIAKGTEKIRKVISKLKQKYTNLEYVELIGKTNAEVVEAIKKCDFIVDQMYSDIPLGVLSTEGAIYQKPSIVGGYIWDKFKGIYNPELIPPSYICHPDQIEQAIEFLIKEKEFRQSLGEKAHEFVKNNWSPEIIAQKILKIINDEVPQEWFKEPIQDYAHFAFVDEQTGKDILKLYVQKYGEQGLFLDDKPKLKKAFLELIDKE